MTEKFKKTYIPHHKENETLDALRMKPISGTFNYWFMQAIDVFDEILDIMADCMYGYITEEDAEPLLDTRYMQLGHFIGEADAKLYTINRKSMGKA